MTTPTTILAAHLGLGDPLPVELGRMVDDAFWRNYHDNPGRHAVAVTLNLRGSEVVQGFTYEGDQVEVLATFSTEERIATHQLPLVDLWRLSHHPFKLLEVVPAMKAIAVIAIAMTRDAESDVWWSSILTDQRGAPTVLIDPSTFGKFMAGGADKRRMTTLTGSVGGPDNVRATAAAEAAEYLASQQEDLTDDGLPSLWCAVHRGPSLVAVMPGTLQPRERGGTSRRYSLRSRISSAVTRDATGRAKVWAKGSSWTTTPLRDEPAGDHMVEWQDTTGETAAALADGDRSLASVAGWEVFTPQSEGWRTAIGQVIDLLRAQGLSERQAFILANRESGFRRADIADAFGCSVRTVDSTLDAARKKLSQTT